MRMPGPPRSISGSKARGRVPNLRRVAVESLLSALIRPGASSRRFRRALRMQREMVPCERGWSVASFRTALYNARAGTRTRFPSLPRMSQRFAVYANDLQGRLPGRAPAAPCERRGGSAPPVR